MATNEVLAILMLVTFIFLVFSGFPVAWLLGGLAIIFSALAVILETDFSTPIGLDWNYTSLTVDRIWNVMENWILVAIPMFIMMGLLLEKSGVANQLMVSFSKLFGNLRGGLAITVTLIGLMLAAATGIIGASVVLLALLGLPIMIKQGYDKSLATGTICAVGTLGILIPPSIMLVIMADRMAMSAGDLFLGAVFPGILLAGLYIAYIVTISTVFPDRAPAASEAPFDWTSLWELLRAILPPAALIISVLASIFLGIATPTEAAGLGAAGALMLATFNGKIGLTVLSEVVRETTRTTGYIFAVLIGATAFSLVLRGLGGDELIERTLLGLPFEPTGILITILLITFILGFFLDWIELTLIILPLVSPIVAGLNFDPIWFTILFAVVLQTSFLTPPVGFAIFYLKGVAPSEIKVKTIYRGVVPFILLQLLGVLIIFNFQDLVTWLPAKAYG